MNRHVRCVSSLGGQGDSQIRHSTNPVSLLAGIEGVFSKEIPGGLVGWSDANAGVDSTGDRVFPDFESSAVTGDFGNDGWGVGGLVVFLFTLSCFWADEFSEFDCGDDHRWVEWSGDAIDASGTGGISGFVDWGGAIIGWAVELWGSHKVYFPIRGDRIQCCYWYYFGSEPTAAFVGGFWSIFGRLLERVEADEHSVGRRGNGLGGLRCGGGDFFGFFLGTALEAALAGGFGNIGSAGCVVLA